MKKTLLSFMLTALCLIAFGQKDTKSDSTVVKNGKNLFKVNLTSLPLNNYNIVYERAVSNKASFGLGLRYSPEGKIPFASEIKSAVDDEELNKQLDNFKMSNYAITPEIKFYFGKDVFRGFYIAPFARYAVYSLSSLYAYEYEHPVEGTTESDIPLSGDITTFTGGLLFGAQWKLSKAIYLDWFIVGPHGGTSKGAISGKKTLSSEEQEGLRETLLDLEDSDIPLVKIKTSVDGNGAKADFSGPWAGIRAGISLGIRF